MESLPPLPANASVSPFRRLLGLAWVQGKRAARGWRWRGYFALSIAAAYWYGKDADFGPGSSSWFPGGAPGVTYFSIGIALAAALLGVEALGQWERQRARRFLDARLGNPAAFLLATMLATIVLAVSGASVVAAWPSIGAMRAGLGVLWTPVLAYLGFVVLPLAIAGAGTGLFARSVLRSDIAALILSATLLAPVLAFRLVSAPASELFTLASGSLGILVPWSTLAREALFAALPGLFFLGLAGLVVLAPRPATGLVSIDPAVASRVPTVARWIERIRSLRRQWTTSSLVACAGLVAAGGAGLAMVVRALPRGEPAVNWEKARQPADLPRGVVPAAVIVSRQVRLGDRAGDPVEVSLSVAASRDPQRFAAFTFGPTVRPASVSGATVDNSALGADTGTVVVAFDPALDSSPRTVKFSLEPRPRYERAWERAYHPRYRRFSFLGPWYGESVGVDFGRASLSNTLQDAPFVVDVPRVAGLDWVAGSARASEAPGGRVRLVQDLPDSPDRLVAAPLVRTDGPTSGTMGVSLLLLAGRERLARDLYRSYAEQLLRLDRLFGQPRAPIYLYEVPEQEPSDQLALSSSLLDNLGVLLPKFFLLENDSRIETEGALSPVHEAIVREAIARNFARIEFPELLRDGLVSYIHGAALGGGYYSTLRKEERRDLVLVPWPIVQRWGPERFPYDITPAVSQRWTGPANPLERSPADPLPDPRRFAAFHHMLRGIIGDDAFEKMVHSLVQDLRGQPLTLAAYQATAEKVHGKPLDWFFDEWLVQGVVPRYRIREAQAFLFEDPATRALQYRAKVTIANEGTGRMPVPWTLFTEGESVSAVEWLGPGEVKLLELNSLERPIGFEIDPEGWIAQEPPFDPIGKRAAHPRVTFRTVTEI